MIRGELNYLYSNIGMRFCLQVLLGIYSRPIEGRPGRYAKWGGGGGGGGGRGQCFMHVLTWVACG